MLSAIPTTPRTRSLPTRTCRQKSRFWARAAKIAPRSQRRAPSLASMPRASSRRGLPLRSTRSRMARRSPIFPKSSLSRSVSRPTTTPTALGVGCSILLRRLSTPIAPLHMTLLRAHIGSYSLTASPHRWVPATTPSRRATLSSGATRSTVTLHPPTSFR